MIFAAAYPHNPFSVDTNIFVEAKEHNSNKQITVPSVSFIIFYIEYISDECRKYN
jgi:hypothetical protein